MKPTIHTHLSIFYALLMWTAIMTLLVNRVNLLKRTFFMTIIPKSMASLAEISWFLIVLVTLFVAGMVNYNAVYALHLPAWNTAGKPSQALIFKTLFHSTGDCLAFLFGLIMLPVSKNSFLATFFNMPYTSLIRVHTWMGRTFFLLSLVHLSCGMIMYGLLNQTPMLVWGHTILENVLSSFNFLLFLTIMITSLTYFRRRWYNTFYFVHSMIFIFITLACVHAPSNMYYLLPGVFLYSIDGLIRLSSKFSKDTITSVQFESCGYISVTVSTAKATNAKPGQFMRLCFPAVSQLEFHPLSIAKANENRVTFMFAPSKDETQWAGKVAKLLTTFATVGSSKMPIVHLQGPYGREIEVSAESENYNTVVFYVGGTGVAACARAVNRVLRRNRDSIDGKQTKVLVVWSCPYSKMESLSHIQPWISKRDGFMDYIVVELFETGQKTSHKMTKQLSRSMIHSNHRADLRDLLRKYVRPSDFGVIQNVGLFVCGPAAFTLAALKSVDSFEQENKGVRVTVEVESFDL
ncbi:UNVERIFIED_CONTAM: hypothetical protein HDU68_010528 [Siphonaria sp. JEL0065]|nr:hypothetical protein HDU68_010528 [Siphonaria sp. JEL0065]